MFCKIGNAAEEVATALAALPVLHELAICLDSEQRVQLPRQLNELRARQQPALPAVTIARSNALCPKEWSTVQLSVQFEECNSMLGQQLGTQLW